MSSQLGFSLGRRSRLEGKEIVCNVLTMSPSKSNTSGMKTRVCRNIRFNISPCRRPVRFLLIFILPAFVFYFFTSFLSHILDRSWWTWDKGICLDQLSPAWAPLPLFLNCSRTGLPVKLQQGTVVGKALSDRYPRPVEAFLGIPYALPPTGNRRLRPPEPVQSGNAKIDATSYGHR